MPETRTLRCFSTIALRRATMRHCLWIGLIIPGSVMADTHAALSCRATPATPEQHPPCGAAAALGPTREPDLDTGISNPVHRITGEKFLRDADLPASLDGASPGFVRLYRSGSTQAGALGAGWTSDYDVTLRRSPQGWRLQLADGRVVRYDKLGQSTQADDGRIQAAQAFKPATGQEGSNMDGITHVWIGPDTRRLAFDTQGRLRRIIQPGQPATQIDYRADAPGLIARIQQGDRRLTPHYELPGPLLRSLETPLGVFRYEYDRPASALKADSNSDAFARPRLRTVTRPDGMQRHYHYEPERQAGHATVITGVTLRDRAGHTQRIRSWTYDAQGRVEHAIPGPPEQNAGRLSLRYPLDGADPVARDEQGRLSALGALRIERTPDGRIRSLSQAQGGWPGLRMDYDAQARRSAWRSTLTGQTRLRYDGHGRLHALTHANGDTLTLRRDAAGRPIHLRYAGTTAADVAVTLQWRGRHPRRLEHPEEIEYLDHNPDGQVLARTIRRPHASGTLHYRETFAYDETGRLLRHDLPEGGALHYTWSADHRLTGLIWETRDGVRHTVIETIAGLAGYRYGNGLQLQAGADHQGRADRLMLSHDEHVLWGEHRLHDAHGQVLQQNLLAPDRRTRRRYAHDAQGRVIGIHEQREPAAPAVLNWLAWAEDGSLIGLGAPDSASDVAPSRLTGPVFSAAAQTPRLPAIRRDVAGLPLQIDDRSVRYQAQQRLADVRQDGRLLVRYTYNARGQQIRQQSDSQDIERYYIDNRLAARWVRPIATSGAAPRFGVSERYLYAQDVPVGLLRTDAHGVTRLFFIHADLLGAPVLMTDETRAVRWSADYDTLGRARRLSGDLSLPLRRPGQDEDPFTGWHDNVFRTYLPHRGHYLEPDPLGPAPGQQALGYAAQQPLRHIDPLGLILLAFDGTRYGRANQSNVWKLTQAYDDGPAYYHAGPGNNLYLDWNAVTAADSGQILRNQWQSLMNALHKAQGSATSVPIDILGYSRGAALARDFANRIARQTRNGWFSYDDPLRGTIGLCVDLRFLGLFDTVAQFGLLGAANAGFDLSIAGAWSWVAHAVALHELRTLFPLVSARASAPANTVEAPFIGAHADIGGGLLLDERGHAQDGGDLSDVALNWMRWQALAALVPMQAPTAEEQQVTRPWLHDERSPVQRLLAGDRDLQDSDTRSLGPQGADPRIGAVQRQAFETFIQRISHWELNAGHVVGQVDMQGYGAWLETQLGLPGMR
ncbi:MAG: DUF2235 domain-containing protein [Castellaniella sp.]|uniref:phospholipase effector Tle1 domain-containing protein n=1 Tax=Castellaniella sp. TaxID=1955812 RepID=UPI003C70E16F